MFQVNFSHPLPNPLEVLGLLEAKPSTSVPSQAPLGQPAFPIVAVCPSPALRQCPALTPSCSVNLEVTPLEQMPTDFAQLPAGSAQWPLTSQFGIPSPCPGGAAVGRGWAGRRAGHRGAGAAQEARGEFLISSAPSSLPGCASLGEKWLSSGR